MKFLKNKTYQTFLGLSLLFLLLKITAPLSIDLQQQCVSFTPLIDENQDLLKALLCGEPLRAASWTKPFLDLQLYHLVVISGSHVVLFLEATKKLSRSTSLLGLILSFGLALLTGFQAPLIRALFQEFFNRQKWTSSLSLLCSGLCCLLYRPDWITSWSLYLSWLAAIGLRWGLDFFRSPTLGAQTLLAVPLQVFSLWGVLANFILAPVLSFFFLYGAWSAVLWPELLAFVFDLFRFAFNHLGQRWALHFSSPAWNSMSWELRWILLALVASLSHILRVHLNRRRLINPKTRGEKR